MKRIFLILSAIAMQMQIMAQSPIKEGIRMMDALQYDQAIGFFNQQISTNQKDADLHFYLGEAYRIMGDADKAKIEFQNGLNKVAGNPLCTVGMGKLKLADSNVTEAIALFDQALLTTKNKDADVLLQVGMALTSGNGQDLAKAEQYVKRAADLDKKNPEVFIALGDVYLEKGDAQLPKINYDIAKSLDPKFPKPYLKLGRIYSRARTAEAYMEAHQYIDDGLKIDPNYAPFYAERAEMYSLTRKFDKAKENYRIYLNKVNNDLYARVRYASFLFLSGEYATTITEIEAIHSKDQSRPFLFRLLGESLYETGNYPAADSILALFIDRQTAKDPRRILGDDYRYIGMTKAKLGKTNDAIEAYRKALSLDPTLRDLYGDIGLLSLKQKDYKTAIEVYNIKIAGNTKPNTNDYYNLGRSFLFAGASDSTLFDSAIKNLTKVTELKADFVPGWTNLGKAYLQKEKGITSEQNLSIWEKILEVTATDTIKYKSDIKAGLGYIGDYYYFEKKDKAKSGPYFEKVLAIDPNDKHAKEMMKKINPAAAPKK